MKKLMFTALACLGLAMTGCKPGEDWTTDKAYTLGLRIGATAGALVEAQKYEATITDKSLEMVDLLTGLIPADGQTFKDAWVPKIEEFVDKQETLTFVQKLGIKLIGGILVSALDKQIAANPELGQKKELVIGLIKGLADGYKTYVKPSNTVKIMSGPRKPELIVKIDPVLYNELEEELKKQKK